MSKQLRQGFQANCDVEGSSRNAFKDQLYSLINVLPSG